MGIPVSNVVWRDCCTVDSVDRNCGLLDRVSSSVVGREVEESILDLILVMKSSSSSLLLLLEELLFGGDGEVRIGKRFFTVECRGWWWSC